MCLKAQHRLLECFPDTKAGVRGSQLEIAAGRRHRKLVANADLGGQCVDGADSNPNSAATIAQLSRLAAGFRKTLSVWRRSTRFHDDRSLASSAAHDVTAQRKGSVRNLKIWEHQSRRAVAQQSRQRAFGERHRGDGVSLVRGDQLSDLLHQCRRIDLQIQLEIQSETARVPICAADQALSLIHI